MKYTLTSLTLALLLASTGTSIADTAESLLARGHAAERAGKWDAASRLVQSAIVADPKRASTYVALADLYMRAGHPDYATFYYAEALQIDPQDKQAELGLATADRETKKLKAATDRSLDKKNADH